METQEFFWGQSDSGRDRVRLSRCDHIRGRSKRHFPIIKAQGRCDDSRLMVSLNRMEKGKGDRVFPTRFMKKYGFHAKAIVTMAEVIEYLQDKNITERL